MANDTADWALHVRTPDQTVTALSANSGGSATSTIPTGAAAVYLSAPAGHITAITVTGVQSNILYLSALPPIAESYAAFLGDALDTQVLISVTHTVGLGNDTVDVSYYDAQVVAVAQLLGTVDVSDRAARSLGHVVVDNVVGVNNQTPALWQAPAAYASVQISSVSSTALRIGVANQVIRVFGWGIEIDQAGGPTIGWIEDDSSAAGTVAQRLAAASSAGNSATTGYEGGKPLTTGAGLRANVPLLGSGGTVRFTVGYSIG